MLGFGFCECLLAGVEVHTRFMSLLRNGVGCSRSHRSRSHTHTHAHTHTHTHTHTRPHTGRNTLFTVLWRHGDTFPGHQGDCHRSHFLGSYKAWCVKGPVHHTEHPSFVNADSSTYHHRLVPYLGGCERCRYEHVPQVPVVHADFFSSGCIAR